MTDRQAFGLISFLAVGFGCLLGEYTRRRDGNPVGAFDAFGWLLLAGSVYLLVAR